MNIVTRADIEKVFTEKAAQLMAKGYRVNAVTSSGSQGETARWDLTNGEEVIRIALNDECRKDWTKVVVLTLERFPYDPHRDLLWGGEGEEVDRMEWAVVDGDAYNLDGKFLTLADYEAGKVAEKRLSRSCRRTAPAGVISYDADTVLRIVHNVKGCKGVKADEITRVRRADGAYRIDICGHKVSCIRVSRYGALPW